MGKTETLIRFSAVTSVIHLLPDSGPEHSIWQKSHWECTQSKHRFPWAPSAVNTWRRVGGQTLSTAALTMKTSSPAHSLIRKEYRGMMTALLPETTPESSRREPVSRELWLWKLHLEGRQGEEIFRCITGLCGLKDFSLIIMVEGIPCVLRHAPHLPSFSEQNRQDKPIKIHSYVLIT